MSFFFFSSMPFKIQKCCSSKLSRKENFGMEENNRTQTLTTSELEINKAHMKGEIWIDPRHCCCIARFGVFVS